jgi:broad specificity polyphosphatase/5'/3'-nucleotidase SurE
MRILITNDDGIHAEGLGVCEQKTSDQPSITRRAATPAQRVRSIRSIGRIAFAFPQ